MRAIHQFVAGFNNGDAISNEARILRGIFRTWGFASEIFCESRRVLPDLRGEVQDVSACAVQVRPDDIVLLHLSIGSAVNDVFASLSCLKAILYHNITPSHFFRTVNQQTAYTLERGREQTRRLAGAAALNMADSGFNAAELSALGYRDVRVLPLVLDLDLLLAKPDAATCSRFRDDKTNALFVGRCVPNKRIEDALRAFHCFQTTVEPNSRFIHVGSYAGTERYYYFLQTLAKELGLRDCFFAGPVTQPQMNAFYGMADVFLCMSEHEGFCIPLLEAMVHGVPVLAYDAGAVAETMDGAGVLVREKIHPQIAEMMGRLARKTPLRDAITRGQTQRLARYRNRNLEQELRGHLAPLLAKEGSAKPVRT
jgi:glycosyltransferase involved in cell wall biosynthesis